jgi:hypothetical protein
VVLENQALIRERGLERWLAAQRTRWSCPSCGTASGWYDKTCSGCGSSLYDCRQEERDIADREGGPSRT